MVLIQSLVFVVVAYFIPIVSATTAKSAVAVAAARGVNLVQKQGVVGS